MSWFLLLLVVLVFAAMAYVLFRRSVAQREAEHAREHAFLMEMQGGGALGGMTGEHAAPQEAAVDQAASAAVTDVPPPMAPASLPEDDATPVSGSGRGYLDRSHQVVWRWLRAGLPGREIFARGSLRRVVGRERVQKDMRLDFVICNEDFEVLAAVDLMRSGRQASEAEFKRALLSQVGVRYACWDASNLPDKTFLTRWVAGAEAQS